MTELWLIDPEQYRVRQDNYTAMMSDPAFRMEAQVFNGDTADQKPYEMREGVAVIDFSGPITNKGSFFSFLFGEAVLPEIAAQIQTADSDPDVLGIVVRMDSPGGPPAGLEEFSSVVRGTSKPLIGYCDSMVCSGGLWAASAFDSLVVSKTASVGSIGVIAVLDDVTDAAAQQGVKFKVLRAGKYKAPGIRYEPLTETGEAVIQAELDYLYSVFIDEIATNTGMSTEEVLKVADGKVFIGQQAVDAGLATKTGFLSDAIEMALDNNNLEGETTMGDIKTVAELRETYPEMCADIETQARAAVKMPDVLAAVSDETGRVIALAAAHFGKDGGDKFSAVVSSGVTLTQYESIKATIPAPTVADAKAEALAKLQAEGGEVPGVEDDATAGPKTFTEAWQAIKTEQKCDSKTAMTTAAKQYPALYEAHAGRGGK